MKTQLQPSVAFWSVSHVVWRPWRLCGVESEAYMYLSLGLRCSALEVKSTQVLVKRIDGFVLQTNIWQYTM
jgi:hypothetical protein